MWVKDAPLALVAASLRGPSFDLSCTLIVGAHVGALVHVE